MNQLDKATQNVASDPRMHAIHNFLAASPHCKNPRLAPLSGDASFRRYIRIEEPDMHYMLMDAPPQKEDVRKYMVIAEYLRRHGYSTPEILDSNIKEGFLLLEDFGDASFSALMQKAQAEKKAQQEEEQMLYEVAIDLLAEWYQQKTSLVNPVQLQLGKYNEALLEKELALFTEWFLPQIMDREEAQIRGEEFMAIWRSILQSVHLHHDYLVHRDFHVDNLMWLPQRSGTKRVGILDFQDAVYGDPAYDVVSLLEDARRDVPAPLAQHLLLGFLYATKVNKDRFMTAYNVLGAQRNCKIIGIFTRLAVRDGKTHYLAFLPRVWNYLQQDLQIAELAPLKEWLDKHVPQGFRGVLPLDKKEMT